MSTLNRPEGALQISQHGEGYTVRDGEVIYQIVRSASGWGIYLESGQEAFVGVGRSATGYADAGEAIDVLTVSSAELKATRTQSLQELVIAVYDQLVTRPGGTIYLADLRTHLNGVDADELDRTLVEMDDDRMIQLEPDPDQRGLTAEMRAAAVRLAGRDLHLMRKVER